MPRPLSDELRFRVPSLELVVSLFFGKGVGQAVSR